jgi:hypothetical protein
MRLRGQDDEQLDVRLSVDELVLVKNVLQEICHGMTFTEGDFLAVFGASRQEVEGLLQRSTNILDQLGLLAE